MGKASPPPVERVIRVFVSSTFRDMQAEREELIKRVFPQLRKLCEERGVTWSEVDLRWGVTDEQKAEGKVLPICLEEVRRCRPYFIGLLGNRYGWVLDELDPAILSREPWLASYRGRSVTEVEIVCGVLDDPAMAEHAFFYFRDPSLRGADGERDAEPPGSKAAKNLSALKDRIRSTEFPVRENFGPARALGELVLADFTSLIDRLFPEGSSPDELDRETARHATFAASRARVYVPRPAYFARLDRHAETDGPPLVVVGGSGLGKSALLANWVRQYRARHPDQFVFVHFLGASPASAEWGELVRRILATFNHRYGLSLEIPDEPGKLRDAFADGLRMVGSAHRLVIVLDGLNQLEDRDQARDLGWLPRELPPGVRLIVSTLPGAPLDEIDRRAWPKLEVALLTREERETLIADYLAQYTKALARPQINAIANAPLAGNPLFLVALLEELRVWGDHETLVKRIDHYLSASSVGNLFQRILARYEADFEQDRPGLVRDAMSAIWAARHGLAEAELLDLLGKEGETLPRGVWSPLLLAAEHAFVSHSGILGFFHDYLRQAVEDHYLPTEAQKRDAHLRLADYFATRDLSQRKIAELPWQLAQAQAWERLSNLLADLPFLKAAWGEGGYDVRACWSQVIEHIPDAPLKAYQPLFDDPNRYAEFAPLIALLLLRLNFPKQSLILQGALLHLFDRMTADHPDLFDPRVFVTLCVETAANYRAMREHEKAMDLVRLAGELSRSTGYLQGVATMLGWEATLAFDHEKLAEAEALNDEAISLAMTLKDEALLAVLLNNKANFIKRSDPARALTLLAGLESLLRETGGRDTLSACLGTQGIALLRLGDLDGALGKFYEQEQLGREIGRMEGVQLAFWGQGMVYAKRRDGEAALKAFASEEAFCRRIGDKEALMKSLLLQASLMSEYRGEHDRALALMREQEELCHELGAQDALAESLWFQSHLLGQQLDHEGGLAKLAEAERVWRELDNKEGLGRCLLAKAERYEASGRPVNAIQALKEAEPLFRDAQDFAGLARSVCNQAMVYARMIRMPAAALPGLQEAEALAESHGLASLAHEIKAAADRIRAGSA